MNTKLIVLLGGVGAVHLAAGALFIAGGCTQEDPPMPPGIYVPKQQPQDNASKNLVYTEPTGPAEPASAAPAADPAPAATALPQNANTQSAPAQSEKASSAPDKVYIVVKNDSLWLIARKNGLTIEELASYNGLSPKTKVRIGQKLYIPATGKPLGNAPRAKGKAVKPAKKGKAASVRRSPAKAAEKLPADGIYTVKERDNFSIIAKRFGIKVSDIIAANPGVDSSRLKIGQKLRLTAGAAPLPKQKKAAAKKTKAKTAKAKTAKPANAVKEEKSKNAAPADASEAKPENKSQDDPEALLNSVKQPQDNAAPEKSNTAPQAKTGERPSNVI